MRTLEFGRQRDAFWRSKVLECSGGEQAVAMLQRDAGLDRGRAILRVKSASSELYNDFRKSESKKYSFL
jgi:hypothetical protein